MSEGEGESPSQPKDTRFFALCQYRKEKKYGSCIKYYERYISHFTRRFGSEGVEGLSIGQAIKERRIAHDLTQEQLAKRIGVSGAMLCMIERGTKVPSLPLSKEIAAVLNCTLEDLCS